MKKVLMLLIAVGAIFTVAFQAMKAEAAEVVEQETDTSGLFWTLYDDGHVSVDGSGEIDSLAFTDRFKYGDRYVLEIGKGITGINPYSIYSNGYTFELTISEDNAYIVTKDDCIVDIAASKIIMYCGPRNITEYTVPEGITGIGERAFYNLDSLKKVTLTEDNMTISSYAFYSCNELRIINVPDNFCSATGEYAWDGSYGYYDCGYWFQGNVGTEVHRYLTLEWWGFMDNSWSYEDGVLTIPDNFDESIVISDWGQVFSPASLIPVAEIVITDEFTTIPDYVFGDDLVKLTIPASVNSISESAFWFSSSLADIVINGDNASYVFDNGALFDKDRTVLVYYWAGDTVREYTVPSSVVKIYDCAFVNCTGLEIINIGANVEELGDNGNTFNKCTNLRDINVDASNEVFFSIDGILYGHFNDTIGTFLIKCPLKNKTTNLIVPEGVNAIEFNAFAECENLESVYLSDEVTNLYPMAFYGCTNLKTVTLSNKLINLNTYAFGGCTSLEEIVIPADVYYVGRDVFSNCPNLKKVTVLSKYAQLSDGWISSENSESTVIYGIKGSTAEKHASANGFEFVELDVEGPASASIQGYWLMIDDSITLRCSVRNYEKLASSDSMYLKISVAGKEYTVFHNDCFESEYGDYYYYCLDFPAVQMTDAINVRLILDGVELDSNTLSIKEYADVILENKAGLEYYEKAKPFVRAMLNYGGYAQNYFDYNTDDKANDGLFAEGEDPVLAGDEGIIIDDKYKAVISASNSSLEYYGMSLVCLGKTEMKFYFKVTDASSASDIMSRYNFAIDGMDEDSFSVEKVSLKMLVIRITGITYADLDELLTVTISPVGDSAEGESGQNSDSISFEVSPMSYIYKAINNGDDALKNLSRALYYLNSEADKYTAA